MIIKLILCFAVALTVIGCGSSGEGGREVKITQAEDGCTPTTIEASTGEKLKFVMTNETGGIYELEGEEGTAFEEVVVPEGKTRSAGFTAPSEEGAYPLKCYVPDGVETFIEINVTRGSGSQNTAPEGATENQVNADLSEYTITPDVESAENGDVTFVATNVGTEVHELVIVRTDLAPGSLPKADDGSVDETGEGVEVIAEIEDLAVGQDGTITIELESGAYVLLCNIVEAHEGDEVKAHYEEGMHTSFTVD